MTLATRNVVVVGATGVVGSGIVRRYLDAGATVVGVSRSADNLARLREKMKIGVSEPFHGIIGEFRDDATAAAAHRAVSAALGDRPIDHVVTAQGFVVLAPPPTAAPLTALERALADGLYNNLLAARVFLPGLKARRGASFTLVSGGLAHIPPPNPGLWLGTVKNAAINALSHALAAETATDEVRVNTICIHFGVAPVGGEKNQFGMVAGGDTLRLAPAFLAVARSARKGQVICLQSWDDADQLARDG
jgi:NAD(P)-dependent dehydrogenase (short-subunit alcohol dehydrogenase family)